MINNFFFKEISLSYIKNKNKYDKILFIAILLGVGVMMFLFNIHSPMVADDYVTCNGNNADIWDCFKALPDFYKNWGGSLFCQWTQWIMTLFNPIVFDICNSVVFAIMLCVLYFHITGSLRIFKPFVLLVVVFSIFMFPPNFGQNFFWFTAACSYLWCITVNLLYVLPLRLQINTNRCVVSNPLVAILYGLAGFIFGFTVANMSIAVVCLFFSVIGFQLYSKLKVYFYEYCGLTGSSIAFLFSLFSPGAQVRIEGNAAVYESFSIIQSLFYAILEIFNWSVFLPMLLVPLFLIIIKKLRIDKTIIFFFIGAMVSHFSMVAVPVIIYSGRVKVIPIYFMTILLGYSIHKMKDYNHSRLAKVLVTPTIVFAVCNCMYIASHDLKQYEDSFHKFESQIAEQKGSGIMDIKVDKLYVPHSKYNAQYGLESISDDSEFWINKSASKYYGVESIRIK